MPDDLIALAAIRKPHGVRGEASVEIWTASYERLEEIRDAVLVSPDEKSRREARIETIRPHVGRALVKFTGIDTPEDVALLRDWTIEIPIGAARTLEENEYFLHDLAGLTLVDEQGRERGTVVEAYEGGAGVLLQVRTGKRTFDVPFAADICKSVDLKERKIIVDLPEGIDEV